MKIFKRKNKAEDLSELYRSFTKVEKRELNESDFKNWMQDIILKHHPINRKIYDYDFCRKHA